MQPYEGKVRAPEFPAVRLQHPLGVVAYDSSLYVADTYNNKIKRIFPATRVAVTFAGTGEAGRRDGSQAQFDEPAGITAARGTLYVADTNNHSVRTVDLASGVTRTWRLQGYDRLGLPPGAVPYPGKLVLLPERKIPPGQGLLEITVGLPPGCQLDRDAPNLVEISVLEDGQFLLGGVRAGGEPRKSFVQPSFPLLVSYQCGDFAATLRVDLTIYYCPETNEGLCKLEEGRIQISLHPDAGVATGPVSLRYEVSQDE